MHPLIHRSATPNRPRQGFTLVELSIVLVIIGLILGGVLIGGSMIRSAELHSVVSEREQYVVSIRMFKDKYNALPGDMINATTFWSTAVNGNGNGIWNNAGASLPAEPYEAWKQLALAGYISGTYSGQTGAGGIYHSVIGTNVPPASMTGGGWSWIWWPNWSGVFFAYDGTYGNTLFFGKQISDNTTGAPILTPAEAYQIDLKADDGIPGTGNVRTAYGVIYAPNCSTSGSVNTNPSASAYNLSYSDIACQLIFILGW